MEIFISFHELKINITFFLKMLIQSSCFISFLVQWHQVGFFLIFTSQFTVLNNHLCTLGTYYMMQITIYVQFSSVQFNNLFKLKQSHMMYILYLSGDNNHYKIKCNMRHNAPQSVRYQFSLPFLHVIMWIDPGQKCSNEYI